MAQAAQAVEEKVEAEQEQNSGPAVARPQTAQHDPKKQVQAVEFSEVAENEVPGAGANIDVLLDMSVPVTAVIDKTEISVRRLLQLGPGSVLRLDKPVGAPVDLYLKDVKLATATVVVIDDRFAVRIEEILGPGPRGPATAADAPDA